METDRPDPEIPVLSEQTLRELDALELFFFKFFINHSKDPRGLSQLPEASVHQHVCNWIKQTPAIMGTARMHGTQFLLSFIATLYSTMNAPDEAARIISFAKPDDQDDQDL